MHVLDLLKYSTFNWISIAECKIALPLNLHLTFN